MTLNARQRQLRERDVRKLSPELNADTFMQLYMESNFPQTSSLPSPKQTQLGLGDQQLADSLKLKQTKPKSGTGYDNPGLS
jgi:hypothetical protein